MFSEQMEKDLMVFPRFLGSVVSCSYGMQHVKTLRLYPTCMSSACSGASKVALEVEQLKCGQLSKNFHFPCGI